VDESGAEGCFSKPRPRVKGDLLWGDFEAWPCIMWTVLNGVNWYCAAVVRVSWS